MKENIGRTPNTITYLNHPIMKISKIIHIRTRNKTVRISLVSIMCLKDSEETTVPIRMEKEKYYVSSLLNSLFNNDVHTKQIHKRITNKTVPISIVFYCVFEKYRTENVCIRMEEKKYYGEIAVSSLHTSICDNGGYTKHIHKCTTNKMVPVSIVSIVCSKNRRQKRCFVRLNVTGYLTSWDYQ